MKRAQIRHKHFHLAIQAAAPSSIDALALHYYRAMFQVFYCM